jgi:predicted nucleic acid-binding protein
VIVFADSSAIVTVYASDEPDVIPTHASVVVSDLARVEVTSALWRKADLRGVAEPDVARMVREFEADWSLRYTTLRLSEQLLKRAADLTATHKLRSLDAIQLASALVARDAEPECRTMVALDERLRRASATERFDILPV